VQAYRRLVALVFAGALFSACASLLGDFQEGPSPGSGVEGGGDGTAGDDHTAPAEAAPPGDGSSDGGREASNETGGNDGAARDGASGETGGDSGVGDGRSGEASGADAPGGDATNGDGGEGGAPLPVLDVLAFALGSAHSCAVVRYTSPADASTVTRTYCWGADDHGQLGGGTVTALPDAGTPGGPTFVVPLTATALSHVASSSTSNTTCGFDGAGQVWCWGANDQGQVNGMASSPAANVATPVRLTDSNTGARLIATQLALGANHACSVDTSSDASAPIFCWGANDHCQAGHPDTSSTCTIPVENVAPAPAFAGIGPVFALAPGDNATVLIDQRFGTHPVLDFIGDSSNGQCDGQSVGDFPNLNSCGDWGQIYPSKVSMGNEHGCVSLSQDGGVASEVDCWGDNSTLQVDPTLTGGGHVGGHAVFTAYADLPTAVGAGNGVSCVVFTPAGGGANYLACQGANSHFQLASDTNYQAAGPVVVNDGAGRPIDVVSVGLGSSHLCALTRATPHSLLCWGDNSFGQVGVPVATSTKGTFDVQSPTRVAFPAQPQ
jgi:alpha-tubulin suppressor-like RCC1 family protein